MELSGGRVALFSPVPLREPQMRRIEALGRIAFLIIPNGFHRLDAGPFKARYPDAKVICPPGAKKRVAKAVKVDSTTDTLRDKSVRFIVVEGTGKGEGALIVRRGNSTTIVVNDIIANVRNPVGLGAKIMAWLFGFGVKHPQMPREVRYFFLKDKAALAAQLREWADLPDLVRVVPSHGDIIDRPRATLERIASGLS